MLKKILFISLVTLTSNAIAAHHEVDLKKSLSTDLDKCFMAVHKKYEGHIVSLEREVEDGKAVYEFDVKTKDGREVEVECLVATHQLHDEEFEVEKNDKRFNDAVKISAEEAEKIALDNTPGKVTEREYAFEGNVPLYEFDIYSDSKGHEIEVEINGLTGEVMETELEIYDIGDDS